MSERGSKVFDFRTLMRSITLLIEELDRRVSRLIDELMARIQAVEDAVADEEEASTIDTVIPWIIIAAADAPEIWIDAAQASATGFVCTGAGDEGTFAEAEALADVGLAPILLSPGTFLISAGTTLTGTYTGVPYQGGDNTVISIDEWDGITGDGLTLIGRFEGIEFSLSPTGTGVSPTSLLNSTAARLEQCRVDVVTGSIDALDYAIDSGPFRDLFVRLNDQNEKVGIAVVHCQGAASDEDLQSRSYRDLRIDVLAATSSLPTLVRVLIDGALDSISLTHVMLMCESADDFRTDMAPIIVDINGGVITNVLISDVVANFGTSFDWTGIDSIVEFEDNSGIFSPTGYITVDVSSFSVSGAGATDIIPPIAATTLTSNTSFGVIGTRVMAGVTADRPVEELSSGALYVNTDGAPVLQWCDGTTWFNL